MAVASAAVEVGCSSREQTRCSSVSQLKTPFSGLILNEEKQVNLMSGPSVEVAVATLRVTLD